MYTQKFRILFYLKKGQFFDNYTYKHSVQQKNSTAGFVAYGRNFTRLHNQISSLSISEKSVVQHLDLNSNAR